MNQENHGSDHVTASARNWKRLKRVALGLGLAVATGIGGLMMISAGKGEDITGLVAPALLLALLCAAVAAWAAFQQKRTEEHH